MALHLRLEDGYSGSTSEEEDEEQVQGEIILGWENGRSRQTTYTPNLYVPPTEPEEKEEVAYVAPYYEQNEQQFDLHYGETGNLLTAQESESEEESEKEEEKEVYVPPEPYRPQLVIVQASPSPKSDEQEEEEEEEEQAIAEKKKEEKEETKEEEITYPTFVPPPSSLPAREEPPQAASSSYSSSLPVREEPGPPSSTQELRNREDCRFLRRPILQTEMHAEGDTVVQKVETVFCCGTINRCSKALWGWPYPIWPRFAFLRFTILDGHGKRVNMAYCMNHHDGSIHFGPQPLFPHGTEERAYPLYITEQQKKELFSYCSNHRTNIAYDRWEERFSLFPMVGNQLVNLWRKLSFSTGDVQFSQGTVWATSYSLIYTAFCRVIFVHSQVGHPAQMSSLAEFFLFIEETAQERVQDQV